MKVSLGGDNLNQKYQSRMKHANNRPRDRHGRFYQKGQAPGEISESLIKEQNEKKSDKSKDITKASAE